MTRLSKVLYSTLVLLLAVMAVKPYWPDLEREWQDFYTAWQMVRSGEEAVPDSVKEAPQEQIDQRDRAVRTPKVITAAPEPEPDRPEDPFLAEARRRAEADPEGAMQWLQEQSSGAERLRGMLEVVALWASKDSQSALHWLESNAQGLARMETLNSGIELWAERDPGAAAEWIEGMANDGSKITAAQALAKKWASQDPQATAAWIRNLPTGEISNSAARTLVETWSENDPQEASRWALEHAELGNGDLSLLEESIRNFAAQDPIAAENFVRELPETINSQAPALAYVSARTHQDPEQAAAWLSGLSTNDPFYSDQYATTVLRLWSESDSVAASAWLSEQPTGPKRDAAIAGFAESMQRFEPEAAAAWANTISNPNQRVETLSNSVKAWASSTPEEALNWLIESDLEPALQEQLAREIELR